ncbi:uroporphyrinogen-III synthase [Marimonas lutisalis]|uniref:uroporphyrinogen-III synthase n=1 Tax=Marimonas lutisalis TaxID=2545756 RepID=UPI0010F4A198|nr:uroporphyrinogen-III synthase [Marimonas lutisalis]
MPLILLTRPEEPARQFAEALRARLGDVEVVISPLLRIEWVKADLPAGVPVFTSANGVEGFLRSGGVAVGACWCVGDVTARVADRAGFDARSAGGDADALVAAILTSGEAGPFVHLRGEHARGDVANRLRAAGRAAQDVVVYAQTAQGLSDAARTMLQGEKPVIVPLFSPRTAQQFAQETAHAPLFVAVMSTAVREALGDCAVRALREAARPDAEAMAEAVEGLFDAALRLEGAGGGK